MSLPERRIRFKEHHPGQRWDAVPTEHQRTYSDGSLGPGPFEVATDTDGFLASALSAEEAAATIVVLGDSVVENLFVPADRRMCRVMERELARLGRRWRVLNGGVSGASTLHSLHVITAKVIPMKPRSVLIMNGMIDSDCLADVDTYWTRDEYRDPLSYAYRPADVGQRGITEPQPALREKLLGICVLVLREFDIDPLFATCHRRTSWAGDDVVRRAYREHQFADRMRRWSASDRAMRSVARRMAVPLFDVAVRFEGRRELLYDDIHMNADGADVIGRWLAAQLAERPTPASAPIPAAPSHRGWISRLFGAGR